MSFIRAKKFSNGRTYYYLVESYRDHGKGKQRVLKYYGRQDPRQGPRPPGGTRAAAPRSDRKYFS